MTLRSIATLLTLATLSTAAFPEDKPAAPATSPATITLTGSGPGGLTLSSGTLTLSSAPPVDIDSAAKTVQKSLVLVEWTYQDENNSRERTGQGIVVGKDVVIIPGNFISENTPREYVKGIKIRLPGKNFSTIKGTLLGRTQNRLFAYIKAEKPLDATPLDISKPGKAKLGSRIFSVAMLDKAGGYDTYIGASDVKAIQRRIVTLAGTSVFGLTRATSPVYDTTTGQLVGITSPPSGEEFIMRAGTGAMARVELFDEQQSGSFFLFEDVADFFKNVPEKPFESPRPWTGVGGMSGLEESVRELDKIEERAGVVIGSTIPGAAADKAGLKPRDIILAIDGKPFSESTVPELMTLHFQGAIDKHKAGDVLTFTVMHEGKRQETKVTLGTAPKVVGDYPHVFDASVGVVTRDLSFYDTYERRLPTETKGVVVALVKNGAPAAMGQTPLRPGFIITKVNDQAVENQKQFADLLKKEAGDPEKKEMVFVIIGADSENKVCRIELNK